MDWTSLVLGIVGTFVAVANTASSLEPGLVMVEFHFRAGQIFQAGCEGLARVDFFVTDYDELVVNEVNTMPGMTETSVWGKLWEASGLAYPDALDRLCRLAVERFDLSLGAGLGKVKGRMFRIGHLGDCNDLTLVAALALTVTGCGGTDGDDDRMLELLEPYRGHRARVQRLVTLSGIGRARRAPRARIRSIASI